MAKTESSIDAKRRTALLEHFRKKSHNELVSFLSCWLTVDEVRHLCKTEEIKVE